MSKAMFFALLDNLREARGYTNKYLSQKLEIPERTLYGQKREDDRRLRITPELILRLAQLMGTTCQHVAEQLGYDYLYSARPFPAEINPFPLAEWPLKSEEIRAAIESAVEARETHSLGELRQAERQYASAVQLALDSREPLFEANLRIWHGNAARMIGKMQIARDEFAQARTIADKYTKRWNSNKSKTLQVQAARKLTARAQAFLIIWHWSVGDLNRVTREAPEAIERLEDAEDQVFLPSMYYFLGRTFCNLEEPDYALYYANEGLKIARGLGSEYYLKNALFLDYPPNSGYQWRVDHLLQLVMDAHIALGHLEQAEAAYRGFDIPRSPASLFSLHHWFSPAWQEYIRDKPDLWIGRDDGSTDATFEMWCEAVHKNSNHHMQATIRYHYAQTLRRRNRLDDAVQILEGAIESAHAAQARFTAVMSSIELASLYLERRQPNDRSRAVTVLDAIESTVATLAISKVVERFERTRNLVNRNL